MDRAEMLLTALLDEVRALREELEDAAVPIEQRIVDLQRQVDILTERIGQPHLVVANSNSNGNGSRRGRRGLRRLLGSR